MITAVECTAQSGREFVDAVCARSEEAADYCRAIESVQARVVSTGVDLFPFYIVELQRFVYLQTREEVAEYLSDTEADYAVDEVAHGNVYRVGAPIVAEVPGRDEMGRWNHTHIEIGGPRRSGLVEESSFEHIFGQFDTVLRLLEHERREQSKHALEQSSNESVGRRVVELDRALRGLKVLEAQDVNVDRLRSIEALPYAEEEDSEYRIVEDYGSDDPAQWKELHRHNGPLRPLCDDLLLRMEPFE